MIPPRLSPDFVGSDCGSFLVLFDLSPVSDREGQRGGSGTLRFGLGLSPGNLWKVVLTPGDLAGVYISASGVFGPLSFFCGLDGVCLAECNEDGASQLSQTKCWRDCGRLLLRCVSSWPLGREVIPVVACLVDCRLYFAWNGSERPFEALPWLVVLLRSRRRVAVVLYSEVSSL